MIDDHEGQAFQHDGRGPQHDGQVRGEGRGNSGNVLAQAVHQVFTLVTNKFQDDLRYPYVSFSPFTL
jgi:hypothetical protein